MALNTALRGSAALLLALLSASCVTDEAVVEASRPSVASARQPTASLKVDASRIQPIYEHRMLAVDLPTVVRVAIARNIDIQEARERIAASRGEYEANIGRVFPSISPNIAAIGLSGAVSTPAGLAAETFKHIVPYAVAIQWIVNPGQVAYDIIASKRRLYASEQQDEAVVMETARTAAVQYYDVVLAQAQVAAARQAIQDAGELLRIDRLQFMTGTGLTLEVQRAEAALALRQQNLLLALNGFYNASVAMTLTLHLDPTVMLVPGAGNMSATTLVREDLTIDSLLDIALHCRPDLQAVRSLFAASEADTSSTIWGGLGPQVAATKTFAPTPPARVLMDTEFRQQLYQVNAGFNWSAATFGRIKTATANAKIAGLEVERHLDQVQASVVTLQQTSLTDKKTIPFARQGVTAAEEALRLTQKNLQAGTGLTLDVLTAQDAADQARLNYASAIVRYNQAEVDLLAALGLLDEVNLEPVGGRALAKQH
jgi:outer membrane protein TolC